MLFERGGACRPAALPGDHRMPHLRLHHYSSRHCLRSWPSRPLFSSSLDSTPLGCEAHPPVSQEDVVSLPCLGTPQPPFEAPTLLRLRLCWVERFQVHLWHCSLRSVRLPHPLEVCQAASYREIHLRCGIYSYVYGSRRWEVAPGHRRGAEWTALRSAYPHHLQ